MAEISEPKGKGQSTSAETICASASVAEDDSHGAISLPVYMAVNYAWDSPREKPLHDYSRRTNPSRDALERMLAQLEGAAKGVVVASGMAALNLVLNLVKPDDLVVAPHDCYGGTHRLYTARHNQGHCKMAFVDQTDPKALDDVFAQSPKMIIIETPSNPLLRVTDIADIVARAHKCGALVVADNTFLSPILQQPLALGCDIVIHSTTKFINGHSDVVGGAVLARDAELGEELQWWANCTGVTGAAFDSFLTMRGARSLSARLLQQQASAEQLVAHLAKDGRVANLFYPGLASHKGHDIAKAQQKGFGALFSAEFADNVDVYALLENLEIFTIAESLGGFESLVCLPASMTHAGMAPEARRTAGLGDNLVRFAIGLEHADDLMADLKQALDKASR